MRRGFMYKSNIEGSVVAEVKHFKYFHVGKSMAEFEILMMEDNCIGSQGKILSTEESFSPGKVYKVEDYNQAIQDIVNLTEEKIKDDEHILETQKYLKK